MKKLLILPMLLLILGVTGCMTTTETEGAKGAEVLVEEMEAEAEVLLKEEAKIEEELIELEGEQF